MTLEEKINLRRSRKASAERRKAQRLADIQAGWDRETAEQIRAGIRAVFTGWEAMAEGELERAEICREFAANRFRYAGVGERA